MSTKKIKLYVGFIVIVAAVGGLIYSATKSTAAFFMRPSELITMSKTDPSVHEQRLRVGGIIVNKTMKGVVIEKKWRWTVSDGPADGSIRPVALKNATPDKTFKVVYNGIIPDTLTEGVMAIMEGKLRRDGVFVADNVMAKCPSKYENTVTTGRGATAKKK